MKWKKGNRLRLVSEAEAPAPTRAIFAEVRHCLGVPAIPLLYQAYASVPLFLELHWRAFQAVLQTRKFFVLADRLAAEAYTRAQSYFDVPDRRQDYVALRADEAEPALPYVLDYYQYLDPLLLLITVAQMQAFDGTLGQPASEMRSQDRRNFPVVPRLAPENGESPAIGKIWEERRRFLRLPFVPEEHRALAMWPELYQRCWAALQPVTQSPLYTDCQFRIGESAWGLVQELPVTVETDISTLLDAGLSDEQVSSLSRINESLMSAFTALLLDVTFTRISLEGGSHQQSWPVQRDEKITPKVHAA
jgi:hypothetical protein